MTTRISTSTNKQTPPSSGQQPLSLRRVFPIYFLKTVPLRDSFFVRLFQGASPLHLCI